MRNNVVRSVKVVDVFFFNIWNLTPSGDNCRTQLDKYIRDHRALADREEKLDRLEKQLQEIQREKRDADLAITELRQRVTSLQQELDTSEAVQKDFVRLSQSLQVKKNRENSLGSENHKRTQLCYKRLYDDCD